MFGALLGLEDVVARNAPVGLADTRRTKNALARSGFLTRDEFAGGDFPSEGMFAGLKSFQRANGLREDGAMKPGGPTERLLANVGRRPARLDFAGSVGISAANRRADVTLARRALAATGHLQPDQVAGDIGKADLSVGIQSFQRDFNLTRDGRIVPGGETQNALGRVVEPGRERDDAMTLLQRPIEPGQRLEENVNFSASNASAKEPAEGESGAAKPAEPDAAIKDFDGGGGGSHGDALNTRARSSGVLGELRDISEKGAKLTQEQKAAMLEKIERAFPHEADRQRGMKSLLRASQMNRKRDIEKERAFLNESEADQNTPERLRKLGDIDRYYERFDEQQRRDLNVARGKARAVRDNRAEVLFERVKNREDNLKALTKAQANGEPTAVFKRNIAGIDAPIREQALRVAQASQAYAALAGLPHPDIDKRGAALQEDMELAARNSGRIGVDLVLGASGGVAGVAAKTLGKEAAKRIAGRLGAGVGMAEAGVAFSRKIQDSVGKAIAKAGIDAGDPAAIRKFAENNKGLLQKATNQALIAAVGNKLSKNAAGNLSRLIGGNALVKDMTEAAIEKGIGVIGSEVRKRQKTRNVK